MKRKMIIGLLLSLFIIFGVLIVCDQMVASNAKELIYDNVESIPRRKVGLIPGTSTVSIWDGTRNYCFDNRIQAGADLYKAGKVDWLVVSGGDSIIIISQKYHNERALYQAKHFGIDAIGFDAKSHSTKKC